MRYVNIRQNSILGKTKSAHWAWSIPLIAITVVAILNPFTGFLFSIDSGGLYSRGSGLLFHWIITWFYLFVAATKVIVTLVREKNKQKRSELMPMLFFFIAPVITGVLQLLFYGLAVTQVGITISLFLVSTLNNRRMVLTDALTGLDNRRSLSNFIESLGNSSSPMRLCILVLDLDQFKEINDHFGHEAGDQALIKASEVLKEIRKQTMMKLFVCRYGKDEFIVIARNCSDSDIQSIRQQIIDGFANTKFHLKTSIGCACGDYFNSDDIQQLVRRADKAMYKEKQSRHIGG